LATRTPAEEEGGNPVEEDNGAPVEESAIALEEGSRTPFGNNGQIPGASLLETFQVREPVSGGRSNPLRKPYSEPGGRRILISI
jgi:hypothetical protein